MVVIVVIYFISEKVDVKGVSNNTYDQAVVTIIPLPGSAVGNMSGNRCESDCRSKGREFDPGPVPYVRGD